MINAIFKIFQWTGLFVVSQNRVFSFFSAPSFMPQVTATLKYRYQKEFLRNFIFPVKYLGFGTIY